MKTLRSLALVAIAVLAACEGPPGPTGPEGPIGPEGPQGPQGPSADVVVVSAKVRADVDGIASMRVPNAFTDAVLVQCWTSNAQNGPWIQMAFALDGGTPSGVTACAKSQTGGDVLVTGFTEPNWWVMAVAIVEG